MTADVLALPRVSEILETVGLGPDLRHVPPAALEYGRIRGKAVHSAIEAAIFNYLDESSLDLEVIPRLDAYRRFVKESGFEPTHAEIAVESATWRYRGHPDVVGWLNGRRVILDWKNGETVQLRPAGRQLSAYRVAWNEQNPREPVDGLAVVQLKGDATFRFWEVSAAEHEPVWLAGLMVFHARMEDGR